MPPRRPAPRRRKQSAPTPSPSSDKPEQEESVQQTSFVIGAGNDEIRWLWPMLSRYEKFHILDVTADEISMILLGMIAVPEETRQKIENLLNDPSYATNMRLLFVSGLDPSIPCIQLPPEFPAPSLAILQVFDKHLKETYYRYHSSALLWLFILCSLLLSSCFGFWMKSIFIIFSAAILTVFPNRKLWVIPETVFEQVLSNNAHRVHLLMTNMMLYSLSYWSPHSTLIKWISVVPYLLLIVRDGVSAEDVRCLDFFCWLLSMAMRVILLYFAWYSWIWTSLALATLLPALFTVLVFVALFICQAGILALDFLVVRVAVLNLLTKSPADFALFPVFLFYAIYFQSRWGWTLSILLIPALGRSGMMGLSSSVIPGVMGRASPIVLFTFLQLGLSCITVLVCNGVIQSVMWIRGRFQKPQTK